MSTVSQNPRSVSSTPEFIALASAIDRSVSGDRAADLLADFFNTVERKVRAEVASDFQLASRHQDEFSWGEAVDIASNGLCSCRGGNRPCPKAGAR